ncbi:MAG: hypothetical protein JWQ49_1300 [Edaphobacter sp.]|nr:hypothetical protein [Edaphobacter sp.]
MAVQSERLQNRPSFSGKRRHAYARESYFQHPSASMDRKMTSSLRKHLGALLGKLSIPLGMLMIVLCLALWLFSGYVLGKLSPEYMVTVQPFEISPEIGNRTSLSGKSASDIVVDILNDAASHAAQFHGTDYYKYVGTGAQPVSLHQAIKVPIQTSYGIELKGISVDSVLHLYNQARYDQWIIGGDVVSSPEGLVGRIRLNNAHTARSWETPPSAHADPSELVRDATYLMLKSSAPELLGQSYLQQADYPDAEKVFRQWAVDEPQNWKGSYYLSLVYGYQDKAQEASNLASWSQDIVLHEAKRSSKRRLKSVGSEKEIAFNLAQTTKVALETRDTSDTQNVVGTLEQAKSKLDLLFKSKPTNVDYWIQRARVLDKQALVELDRNSPKGYERSRQAIDSLDKAIQRVPENGGLHEQRAILLMHLVTIMKKQGKGSQDIRAKESEEAKEYTRALELRPQEDSALWGAVYAQIDLGNGEDAVDLARTITLLQPDSKTASTAYIVALERAIKAPGKEPKREHEVEDRLKRLLQSNPDESQVLAVWDALMTNNDREGLDLVVAGTKRLFPENFAFEERKLQRYLLDLLHYDGQTGN